MASYRRILITGGAGFAGSALALALKRELEADVIVLDNLRRAGSERNLECLRQGGVRFVRGDVRLPGDLLMDPGPDLIIECSAEPSAQAGYRTSPAYAVETNAFGCFNCLELARRSGSDFLFLSTSRVYPYKALNALEYREEASRFSLCEDQRIAGASGRGIGEAFPLDGPRSIYGMTKLAAELMVVEYGDAYGIRYIIDRFGLIAGPRQMARSDQGVLAWWVAAHHYRRPLSYLGFGGTGKQVRDFLDVDDFCALAVDQVKRFEVYAGQQFNVGGGLANSLSLREATDLCREITGVDLEIGADRATRPADVRVYVTDLSKIVALTEWRPRRDARATLAGIHAWLCSEGPDLERVLFD